MDLNLHSPYTFTSCTRTILLFFTTPDTEEMRNAILQSYPRVNRKWSVCGRCWPAGAVWGDIIAGNVVWCLVPCVARESIGKKRVWFLDCKSFEFRPCHTGPSCETSGCCRGVGDVFFLPECYAMDVGSCLPTFRDILSFPSPMVKQSYSSQGYNF